MPGQSQAKYRQKSSEYAIRLREKQKLKRIFGLTEKQFRINFTKSNNQPGVTGDNLITNLERRLDNAVYRLGFLSSRSEARQFVNHGHVMVNGKKVNIPSYSVKEGDVIEVRDKSKEMALIVEALALKERDVPEYIEVDFKKMIAKFKRVPELSDVPYPAIMEPNLVVEYYAKN